jgi:hypothetical protein
MECTCSALERAALLLPLAVPTGFCRDVLRLSSSEATFGAFSTGDPWREEPRKRRREEEVYGMRPGMGMDDFGGKGWGKGMPPPIRQYSEPFSSPEFGRGKGGFKGPCAVVDSVN